MWSSTCFFETTRPLLRISSSRTAVSRVEFQICDTQGAAKQLPRTPQLSFQPCNELLKRKWLDQIVVSAAAQSLNAIVQSAAGGKHQDGNRIVAISEFAQQCQAVSVGQSEIEDESGVECRA